MRGLRRTAFALVLGIGLLAPTVRAADTGTYIEQEVVRQDAAGQPATRGAQRIWITPQRIRNETEFDEEGSAAIFDLEAGRVILLPTDGREYIEMKLADYQRVVALRLGGLAQQDENAQPKLSDTGESRTIGKWACRKWVFEQGGRTPFRSELWVAKDAGLDFTAYVGLNRKMGLEKMLGRLADFADKINGYPIEVKTEQTIGQQTLTSTTRVKRIVSGPVDPALFRIPKGYKRLGGDGLKKP